MPKKMPGFYAPDPHHCLQRPIEWRYITTEPWVAMNSDGSWYSWTHEPVYKEDDGLFVYPDLDCSMDNSHVRDGHYNPFHFSHEQCRASVYKNEPENKKKKYCFICDNHGGTLQPCLGCGKGPNSPAALSLDGGHSNAPNSEVNLQAWKTWEKIDVQKANDLLMGSDKNCRQGSCLFHEPHRISGHPETILLSCSKCGDVEHVAGGKIKPEEVHPEILIQVRHYLKRNGHSF